MNILILFVGFLFGAILQYAKLNRYNLISGMQLSLSSLLFAVFVFGGLLLTGRYFYKFRN